MKAASHPGWRRELELWLESLAAERGLSPRSVAAYRGDLVRLGEWLAKRRRQELPEADAAALAEHVRWLHRREVSARSIARALSAARGFYGWRVEEGLRGDDPTATLVTPRRVRRLPAVLGERDVASLLAAPDV
ncbi:MAG: site-specific integrase, partial [Thermoanaerobaculia bacterium]|nr:site-specific integrase [Thermoanaerobaculia bacterium]